jgi:hypothetical protein
LDYWGLRNYSQDIKTFKYLQTTLLLTVSCPRLKKVHVAVCHGDQWAIYKEIESKYSGVNNFLKAVGVELHFSNPYVSAHSSIQSSRQNSSDEDHEDEDGDNNDDSYESMLSSCSEDEDMDEML